jgi:hypothetical protein
MDNLDDDFLQAFSAELSAELLKSSDSFTKLWMIDKISKHSDGKHDVKERMYWYSVWNFVNQNTETFAKTLPEDAKSSVESHLKEIEKHFKKLISPEPADQR